MSIEDLNRIEAEAAASEAIEGEHLAAGQPEPEPQGPTLADEIGGLVRTVVAILAPMLPSLTSIYTEPTIDAASGAVAKVCEKHGWLGGGIFGEFGEEITCAMILAPLAIQTNAGIRADLAALKAKQEAQQGTKADEQQAA